MKRLNLSPLNRRRTQTPMLAVLIVAANLLLTSERTTADVKSIVLGVNEAT